MPLPSLDVLAQPEADAALAQVDDRPGKVAVAVQIRRDTVVVREPKNARYLGCADEILGVDLRSHTQSLGRLTILIRDS